MVRTGFPFSIEPQTEAVPLLLGHRKLETHTRNAHQPDHSITSSAPASSDDGMAKSRAFAVFLLMTSSKRVGCWIGRSAGFAPRRMRSTQGAACRRRRTRESFPLR